MNQNKLTLKQQLFCEHYLANGGYGEQAAISSGYSRKTASVIASENLNKPYIKAFIAKKLQPMHEELGVTAKYIIKGIKDIAETATKTNDKGVNPDYYTRLKALELLGKYKELALFKETTENTQIIKELPPVEIKIIKE